jgi:membrane-associated protease RseP (regulator of RpoE activity)
MIHGAPRDVSTLQFGGTDYSCTLARANGLGLLIALLIAAGGAEPRADDAATPPAKPAFEAGDISIGEPITLPFARPKAADATTAGSATAVAPVAPGQGWLGITVAESTVPGRWAVDEVAPRSPAMAAGINPGDEVRAIGGLPLRNADDVAQALTSISPGQEVRLAIGRGEQVSDVTLTAVPRPTAVARSLQNLPVADPAAAAARQAPEMSALAPPPAAPAAALAPLPINSSAPPPVAESLATLPLAPPTAPMATAPTTPSEPLAVPPPASLPIAPPAAAFAAAPPIDAGVSAAIDAPPTAPRFPRRSASAEPPVASGTRFEPAAPTPVAEPPARVPQPALAAGGRIALGVRTIPIDPDMQARFNLPAASGAYVIGVVGDLPASKAGVPPGSVIVALDERPVRSPDELTRLVTSGPVGKPVPLEYVLPGGASRRAEVVLQTLEQPLEEALVGPPGPTAVGVPSLEPQPEPTTARRPATIDEASALRAEIRQLEARLQALERRLTDR